ncbi:MAG: hypothetical protein GY830_06725, partial [Bacteroidetes bacterium]|nr:hypothetical protein [Bacteroidota bacterium]
MIRPRTAGCGQKKCIEGKTDKGHSKDRTCKDCKRHHFLGNCAKCLKEAGAFREKILAWAQKGLGNRGRKKKVQTSLVELSVSSAVVNGMPVGESLTLSEVVQAKTPSGHIISVCLLYDSQAETSCMSPSLHRLSHPKVHPDALTIHGVGASTKRSFSEKGSLILTDPKGKEITIEGLIQDHPMAKPKPYTLPPEWAKEYKGSHAVQVRDKPTNYSVLVGSDLHIHPLPCLTPEGGQLLDSSGALALFRSQITHRYLCVGQAKDRYFPGQDDTDKDFVAQHSALHAARLEVVSEELADVQSPPWSSRPSIEEVLSDEEEPTPGLSLGRVRFGRDYDTDIEEDSFVTSTLDEDLRQPCNHGPSDDAATALTS